MHTHTRVSNTEVINWCEMNKRFEISVSNILHQPNANAINKYMASVFVYDNVWKYNIEWNKNINKFYTHSFVYFG